MYTPKIMDKKRFLERKVNDLLDFFPAIAILGPRQCGKSTLSRALRPNWKYYDLERPDHFQLISSDPLTFFELNPSQIIIDEAQQFPQLFSVLRSIIDENRQLKGRFILTGSSSPEIVKGLSESLAGRIASLELSPFKCAEFYDHELPTIYQLLTHSPIEVDALSQLTPAITTHHVLNFWFKGGYPEPLMGNSDFFYRQWMENYINDYFIRDIRSLFPKLNLPNFRRFVSLLAQHSGLQLNMSNMSRALEVNNKTIKDYLDIVHDTFIWRNLSPFENNPLKRVQKANKGFFRDQGVLHHLLKIQNVEQLLLHPIAGTSFESFAIEEVIRGLQATNATQLNYHYYRTIDKSEVDLVIDAPSGIIPIEIKLGSITKPRALKALHQFIADCHCELGIVINNGQAIERLSDKVIQIPMRYW